VKRRLFQTVDGLNSLFGSLKTKRAKVRFHSVQSLRKQNEFALSVIQIQIQSMIMINDPKIKQAKVFSGRINLFPKRIKS